MMMEMMGAFEQMAGMIDQVRQENQQLLQNVEQLRAQQSTYDATVGELKGKSDMLVKMLRQPPQGGMV